MNRLSTSLFIFAIFVLIPDLLTLSSTSDMSVAVLGLSALFFTTAIYMAMPLVCLRLLCIYLYEKLLALLSMFAICAYA